jgi:hypothetical protein
MRRLGMVQLMTCPVLPGSMSEVYRNFFGGDTFFWTCVLCWAYLDNTANADASPGQEYGAGEAPNRSQDGCAMERRLPAVSFGDSIEMHRFAFQDVRCYGYVLCRRHLQMSRGAKVPRRPRR